MIKPLKAIVLILEFTRVDQGFLVPMILAVAGSAVTHRFCTARAARSADAARALRPESA